MRAARFVDAIEAVGFEAVIERGSKDSSLRRLALVPLPGVASVSLAGNLAASARPTQSSTRLEAMGPRDALEAIQACMPAGVRLELAPAEASSRARKEQKHHRDSIAEWRAHLRVALAFALPAFALSMVVSMVRPFASWRAERNSLAPQTNKKTSNPLEAFLEGHDVLGVRSWTGCSLRS